MLVSSIFCHFTSNITLFLRICRLFIDLTRKTLNFANKKSLFDHFWVEILLFLADNNAIRLLQVSSLNLKRSQTYSFASLTRSSRDLLKFNDSTWSTLIRQNCLCRRLCQLMVVTQKNKNALNTKIVSFLAIDFVDFCRFSLIFVDL